MANPTTIYFRRESEPNAPAASPFTGRFTQASPFIVHDGTLGDDEITQIMASFTTGYDDFSGDPAPAYEFVTYPADGTEAAPDSNRTTLTIRTPGWPVA